MCTAAVVLTESFQLLFHRLAVGVLILATGIQDWFRLQLDGRDIAVELMEGRS